MSTKSKAKRKANNQKPYKRKANDHKPDTHKPDSHKPDTTLITTRQTGEQDKVKLVDNKTGKLVPTKEDKAKIDAVKKAQRQYHKAKLEAQEALRKVKEQFEALSGSETLKTLKAELEAKLEAKQTEVTEAREAFKALVDEYNSLSVEYQELTGISKKAIKANGKTSTGTRVTANGNWLPTIKAINKDSVKVIVKHAPTNDLFEHTLFANGKSGMISYEHWLDLRHAFTKHYQTLYDSLDTGSKANFRAFLYPRLHGLVSQVKAIADKID